MQKKCATAGGDRAMMVVKIGYHHYFSQTHTFFPIHKHNFHIFPLVFCLFSHRKEENLFSFANAQSGARFFEADLWVFYIAIYWKK